MKNKIILSLLLLGGILAITGCDESSSTNKNQINYDFKYDIINSNEVILGKVDIDSACKKITIPDNVEINDKTYNVVAIGRGAFKNCEYIKNVIMSDGIKYIENSAFESSSIETIKFSSNLESIGESAFKNSKLGGDIVFPQKLIKIENCAFWYCNNIESVYIPKSLVEISGRNADTNDLETLVNRSGAFFDCCNLNSITVDPENPVFDSREDCNALIHTKTNCMFDGTNNTFIPNTIETIDFDVFHNKLNLHRIFIPASVVKINSYFWNCEALEFIDVDSQNKFYYSTGSNCLVEKETETVIGGCVGIVIPTTAKKIREKAFYCCLNIGSIMIPGNIEYVGNSAFGYWTENQEIYVYESESDTTNWDKERNKLCDARIKYGCKYDY